MVARSRRSRPCTDGETEWAGRRKAQPAGVMLPATRQWMNSLPPDYRPHRLAIRFPRIANLIAARWDSPKECTAYMSSLLHDERGGRKGFPAEVQEDITDLRTLLCDASSNHHLGRGWRSEVPPLIRAHASRRKAHARGRVAHQRYSGGVKSSLSSRTSWCRFVFEYLACTGGTGHGQRVALPALSDEFVRWRCSGEILQGEVDLRRR